VQIVQTCNAAAMSEKPDTFLFNQLLSGFRSELYELLGTAWADCVRQGFDQTKVERAIVSTALSEIFDLAVESLGPEECARFISAVVNERLKTHQQR
jgi:hypothetical protein